MKIAYLVNQYPKVSHSFIRREILGVEACGIEVLRFSIRSLEDELVDEADQQELKKTRFVLNVGAIGLLFSTLWVLLTRPSRWFQAFRLATQVGLSSERGLVYHWIYLAEACVLLRWLRAAQVDQLHVHFGTNSTTVAMLCHELGGPPYSFTVHGPEEFDKPLGIGLPEKIKRAEFVVAISSFGKSQLFRWCDYTHWPKIHVVRCGVDQLFMNQALVPIPEEPRFVCVGRLSEQKGHLLLIEAVGRLASQGLKFKLTLVGDGSLRPQVEAQIAQNNLEDFVEITGWATNAEVRQYVLNAQVLALPSFAEGLPVVIMEALALARPVVSTYVAGIPELVEPGYSGWLVPAGSVDTLVQALEQVLETPATQLEEMGKRGREKTLQNHNIETEASRLAEIFREMHEKRSAQSLSV
ncbi:MAG: glycosyltransferase [Microcoleaceae cyanobacterium]